MLFCGQKSRDGFICALHASLLGSSYQRSNQNVTSLTSLCDRCDVQIERYANNKAFDCIN